MRTSVAVATAALAIGGSLAVSAGIAAAEPGGNAASTIADLQSQGYSVVVDRVGSLPTNQCTVTNVRNPQTVTATRRSGPDRRNREIIIVSQTITVSLNCQR